MSERYIRQNVKSNLIVKSSKTYAKITDLDDAIFIRDFLIENDWDLDKTPNLLKKDDTYLVLMVYDDKIHLISKYKRKPDEATIENLIKRHKRNPNNSRYGLNIVKVFDTFAIKKQIAGDDYIFGYYDNLSDAEFVRNFLMDNNWNVNAFGQIEFDEDTDTYKAVYVIDDKVYVLGSFNDANIDLSSVHEKFLAKISKHKYGLASYPHLDLLKDSIEDLEAEFGVKASDDVWSFSNASSEKSALSEIIFALTPFEQSVYDAIGNQTSFDEIKRALIRYRSKNFENKITTNLDSLIEKGLIVRDGEFYKKTNY